MQVYTDILKEKLLIWLGEEFLHFGIANSLQKFDYDLYAVIANPNPGPKKFHQNQKIVNFSKSWFVNDNVTTNFKKPDMDYLTSFENQFGISIWKIAYSERYFYRKHNPFHIFSLDEILFILEQECKLFEKILEEIKPDYFLVSTITNHPKFLLYSMCKAKNISILTLESSRFKGKSFISSTIAKVDHTEKFVNCTTGKITSEKDAFDHMINFRPPSRNVYDNTSKISKFEKITALANFIINPINEDSKNEYLHYGKTKTKILKETSGFSRLRKIEKRESFIDEHFKKELDFSKPFMYYPLQAEPERELYIQAPYFTDQISLIKNIAKSIPVNSVLFVKEHPVMKKHAGWRELDFYKQLMDLPNVVLIHPSVDSHELIKHCDLVLTISGDAAFEAGFYKKSAVIFSDPDYLVLSNVFQVKNLNDLPLIISKALKFNCDTSELVKFVNYLEQNSFEFDRVGYFTDVNNYFHYVGFSEEVKITDSKMLDFLKKYKQVFNILSYEHDKKIKEKKSKTK
jgi:hypothetical protein